MTNCADNIIITCPGCTPSVEGSYHVHDELHGQPVFKDGTNYLWFFDCTGEPEFPCTEWWINQTPDNGSGPGFYRGTADPRGNFQPIGGASGTATVDYIANATVTCPDGCDPNVEDSYYESETDENGNPVFSNGTYKITYSESNWRLIEIGASENSSSFEKMEDSKHPSDPTGFYEPIYGAYGKVKVQEDVCHQLVRKMEEAFTNCNIDFGCECDCIYTCATDCSAQCDSSDGGYNIRLTGFDSSFSCFDDLSYDVYHDNGCQWYGQFTCGGDCDFPYPCGSDSNSFLFSYVWFRCVGQTPWDLTAAISVNNDVYASSEEYFGEGSSSICLQDGTYTLDATSGNDVKIIITKN